MARFGLDILGDYDEIKVKVTLIPHEVSCKIIQEWNFMMLINISVSIKVIYSRKNKLKRTYCISLSN